MFRTIKAKFPGVCKRCHASIYVGDSIRYGGPGRTYHLAKVCGEQYRAAQDGGHAPDLDRLLEDRAEYLSECAGDR